MSSFSRIIFAICQKNIWYHKTKTLYLHITTNNRITMNAISLNNLWSYIQGLSLTSNNQRWLAQRLIEASSAKTKTEDKDSKMQKLDAIFGALNNAAFFICAECLI